MSYALALRDSVYLQIFGTKELDKGEFYFNIDGDEQKYCYGYIDQVTGAAREKVYSNAEALFGSHVTVDWAEVAKAIIDTIFSAFNIPDWMTIAQLGVNAIQAIFFSRSIVGTSTDAVKELINNSKDFKQRTMSWGTKTFIDASTVWLSSLDEIFVTLGDIENDIQIYNAVNSQDYRLEINDESLRVSMYDIISLCNYVN
jgi:hypothetical protein